MRDRYQGRDSLAELRRGVTALSVASMLLYSSVATAEDKPAEEPSKDILAISRDGSARERFRLGELPAVAVKEQIERQPTAEDFTWEALTKGSLASGKDPAIGSPARGGYYDFRDGLSEPVYFVAKLSTKK